MNHTERLVKRIYTEMVKADKMAFSIMGKIINGPTEQEELEFDRLSTRAVTLENLLLDSINSVRKQELLDNAKNSKDINAIFDCFMVTREAGINENGEFLDWNFSLHLFTKSHEMSEDEFWHLYEKYL